MGISSAIMTKQGLAMSLKRTLTQVALLTSLVAPQIAQAAYWSPHLGADIKYWNVEPKFGTFTDYEYLFPEITKAVNLYVGTRINGYFGVDLGYEQSAKKKNYKVFDGTEIFFVSQEAVGDGATVNMRLHAFHLDLNFYWEVVRRFELNFMMGLVYLHPDTHIMHLTDGTWLEFRNKTDEKWYGSFGFGALYTPIPNISIRALVAFDQTQRINYLGYDQNNDYYDLHPYKHATTFNLGVIWNITPPRRTKSCADFEYR